MSTVPARVLICAAVLTVTACTSDSDREVSEVVAPEPDPVEELLLVYDFESADRHTYQVELEQQLVLETTGSSEAVAEEGIPSAADVIIVAVGTFTFTYSAGPDEGTYTVDIDGQFTDVVVTGTVDGQPVDDASDLADLGAIEPVSASVVVDHQGRIVDDTTVSSDPLGFGVSPLAGVSGDLRRLPGPILPEGAVAQGDQWTEDFSSPGMADVAVATTVTSTLTAAELADGRETVVIDSVTNADEAVMDLSEFFAGFMGAFFDPDEGDSPESIEALIDQVVFRITMPASTSTSQAWLDPDGTVVRSAAEGVSSLRMAVVLPDDQSGELENFDLSLDVDQSLVYTLLEGGS